MNTTNERRKHPRIEVNWPIQVFVDGDTIEGEIKNITLKGLFICCKEALHLRENFSIAISPPDGNTINVVGKAIWSDFYAMDEENAPVCVGMSFVEISAQDRHLLKELLEFPLDE